MVATPSETEIKFLLQAFKRKFGLMQHQARPPLAP